MFRNIPFFLSSGYGGLSALSSKRLMQLSKHMKNLSEDNFLGCKTKHAITPRNSYLASWWISKSIKEEDMTIWENYIVNVPQRDFRNRNFYVKIIDSCRSLY